MKRDKKRGEGKHGYYVVAATWCIALLWEKDAKEANLRQSVMTE